VSVRFEPGRGVTAEVCTKLARRAFDARNEEDSVTRTDVVVVGILASLATLVSASACSSQGPSSTSSSISETNPACTNGSRDGDETGVDCGGSGAPPCPGDGSPDSGTADGQSQSDAGEDGAAGGADGIRNGTETDVDCGGPNAPKCAEGKSCLVDTDCDAACNYAKKCVAMPSCRPHLGGDTCGTGEVGESGAQHESCCRTLKVPGYSDAAHPGKAVYLDKYEITAGRIRAFVAEMTVANGGKPDV
jgi:hypothetical protein